MYFNIQELPYWSNTCYAARYVTRHHDIAENKLDHMMPALRELKSLSGSGQLNWQLYKLITML